MNSLLWICQVLLAVAFFAHGAMFLSPPASIVEQMNASLPRWFQLFLGVAEVAAAVGLTLPGLTRVKPRFVPLAAAGIMIVIARTPVLATTLRDATRPCGSTTFYMPWIGMASPIKHH